MVNISRKTNERNDIETIVDNDEILWLNEKHIEEGLTDNNLQDTTTKYHSDHRKHRYKLVEEPKNYSKRIFINEKLAVKVIMNCRTTSAHKRRTKLQFEQYDGILTKEQSVLIRIMSLSE